MPDYSAWKGIKNFLGRSEQGVLSGGSDRHGLVARWVRRGTVA